MIQECAKLIPGTILHFRQPNFTLFMVFFKYFLALYQKLLYNSDCYLFHFGKSFPDKNFFKEEIMKFSIKKSKAVALFLAMVLAISGLFTVSGIAKAADSSSLVPFLQETGDAVANTPVNYGFNITASTYAAIEVIVPEPVIMNVRITRNSDSYTVYNDAVPANTDSYLGWSYDTQENLYYHIIELDAPAVADYNLSLTFNSDTKFVVYGAFSRPSAVISNSSIILTKGFSQKLSVSNATVSKWSSSNTKVAAVDKNGKVTAKATGTATISAATSTGEIVKCAVTVKANAYTRSKLGLSQTNYGHAYIDITKVSYNKKGDLVIKASFLNNRGYKMTQILNLKINVKNKSGKTIGTYSAKSKKVSIPHGGSKTFTFTVKKAKLKQKSTQDLRQAKVTPAFEYKYQIR